MPDRYAFLDVRGHFQPSHFRGPTRHYRVRPAFRSADREQHSAQSTRGLHLLPCCFHAALRLSVLCSAGTPPSCPRASCQTFSQSREALTSQHNSHSAPVAPFQTEVIQHMHQQLTGDSDHHTFQFGKVQQASQTGLMPLAEHDLLLCTRL